MCWPLGPEDLCSIIAPTLLLAGNRSPAVVRRIHTLLARALPNRRIGSFDCGHMGPITDAHRVDPCIEAFLEGCVVRDAAYAAPHIVSPASSVSVVD